MQVSAELRWFWRGELTALRSWFHDRLGTFPPGGGKDRIDKYLADVGQTELGLKTRGDKPGVEVKGLVSAGERSFEDWPFRGRVQIFTKWTTEVLGLGDLSTAEVTKVRWLRKFDADSTALRERELGVDERLRNSEEKLPDLGCHVELTRVSLAGVSQEWWTLGLEAFGPLDSVGSVLRRTLAHIAGTRPPTLSGGEELSYPAWLALILPAPLVHRIETIHHVNLPIADLERSKQFYSNVLGLPEVARPPFDFPGAWYQLGDRQLHLIVHDHSTFRVGKAVDSRDVHFAIRVASYRETRNFLRSKGFASNAKDEFKRMKETPRSTGGWPQLYIIDPDRNVIEFNAEQLDDEQ